MREIEPGPLWREVVGDTEPWRRGRIGLVIYAALSLINHACGLGVDILSGNVERLLFSSGFALVFWFLFYLIWIGLSWVRWITCAFSALVGFALIIWGWRDGVTFEMLAGGYGLASAAYVGLAPSVYFFAKRQRENVHWLEAGVVALICLLILASLGAGAIGLARFREAAEVQAHEFADRAFIRIYREHDVQFFFSHATPDLMKYYGRGGLSAIMTQAYLRVGEKPEIGRSQGRLRCWYKFPATLVTGGWMTAEGDANGRPIDFRADVGTAGRDWEINGIGWQFRDGLP